MCVHFKIKILARKPPPFTAGGCGKVFLSCLSCHFLMQMFYCGSWCDVFAHGFSCVSHLFSVSQGFCRRPCSTDLWRHQRDHEGAHRPSHRQPEVEDSAHGFRQKRVFWFWGGVCPFKERCLIILIIFLQLLAACPQTFIYIKQVIFNEQNA